MDARQARPGGRFVAADRGAFLGPVTASPLDEPRAQFCEVPRFPLCDIARIDWASIFEVFPAWRTRLCN